MSAFLTNTTLPDRPQRPENIEVVETTSQTTKIKWTPPKKKNGPLSFYLVKVQFKNLRNETISREETTDEQSITLKGLQVSND